MKAKLCLVASPATAYAHWLRKAGFEPEETSAGVVCWEADYSAINLPSAAVWNTAAAMERAGVPADVCQVVRFYGRCRGWNSLKTEERSTA